MENSPDLSSISPSSSSASSPEFAFWMVGNPPPSLPDSGVTADELFADGVILPLVHPPQPPAQASSTTAPPPPPPSPPPAKSAANPTKKWKQIFRARGVGGREKATKPPPPAHAAPVSAAMAELNIHLWPFSRSRSAGSAAVSGPRPRAALAAGQKSCSAPCSRSNSRGDAPTGAAAGGGRKWGPLAGGVHVGRSVPVWRLKKSAAKSGGAANDNSSTTGMLGLNVNTCIGYGSQGKSCRSEDKEEEDAAAGAAGQLGGDGGDGGRRLFGLRGIFSKKVY